MFASVGQRKYIQHWHGSLFLKKVRDLYSVMFIILKGEMLLAGKSISRLMNTFMLIAYIAQG